MFTTLIKLSSFISIDRELFSGAVARSPRVFSLELNCQLQTFIELFLKSQSDDRKSPDDLFQAVAQNHKQCVSDTLKNILPLYSAATAAV